LKRDAHQPGTGVPSIILEVLNTRKHSLSINLLGVPLADRPSFFQTLLSRLQELRARTGRPHWIVVDEAHHLLPAELDTASLTIPNELATFARNVAEQFHLAATVQNLKRLVRHLAQKQSPALSTR
jgi:hypothetical protein